MYTLTLTTDFGNSLFPAILKGVLLKINPSLKIITISNSIEKFNIHQAKFIIENSYHYFPEKTIHLCVVDPGVGSERKGIIVKTEKYFFVGPDNGIFSFLKENDILEIYEINYKPENCSATFHARDIFAPVCGFISLNRKFEYFSKKIPIKKTFTFTNDFFEDRFKVIFIDDFGNIFLNIKKDEFFEITKGKNFELNFKGKVFKKLHNSYSEVKKGELLLLINSFNYLEIAVREGNAKEILNAKVGDRYEIKTYNS